MVTSRFATILFGAVIAVAMHAMPWAQVSAQESDEKSEAESVERTIYVPFAKLRDVFEKDGRGVFLPYEEFDKLWKAAQLQPEPPAQGPPMDSIITAVTNEAVVETDVVRVNATLTIELLKQGWNSVPLRLHDAAILEATIGGEPARVTPATDGGYQLLVENADKDSTSIELKLVYARAFDKTPGKNSVGFAAPQAPVNRWKIRIPQAGVKVSVDPMIAATEDPSIANEAPEGDEQSEPEEAAEQPPSEQAAEETVLLAFVGAAPNVTIQWTPKAEGATGLEALISVQAQQEVFVSEGAVRTRVNLTYEISRSQVSELKVEVPGDQKVVNVFDQNVRKWNVTQQEDAQLIEVELFEPAASTQQLTLELEKFHEAEQDLELEVAEIRVLGVGRQLGTVVVQVDPALRAEARKRTGLQQLDTSELPARLANQAWTFAYRYAALPFALTLNIEKVQPRITVEQFVQAFLTPESISVDLFAVYTIEQAGVFQFELRLPDGFEVQQVVGREMAGSAAAVVDSYQTIQEEGWQRLRVSLTRKALGTAGLFIRLSKRLNDPNLLSPTGVASEFTLDVPRAEQEHMARSSGTLVVYSPESLRVAPTTEGLRPIAISEAQAKSPQASGSRSGRAILAYEFADQTASLAMTAERRKPYVTAKQRLLVQVEEGVVKFESLILAQIQYSGIQSMRVDIPEGIASEVRNARGDLRDKPIVPAPDDVAEGYVAWEFTGETELLGDAAVRLTWETKIDELAVGSTTEIPVPSLKPRNVDRAWGQIVVTKSQTLDVEPSGTPEGLRPIDPNLDVMAEARVNNAARAFEFNDDWSLTLNATRYQLEEVKRTSIERAVVRTVVTRSGVHNVQALYRLRSARQRLSLKLPEGVEFDTQPVRINGNSVALERGEQGLLTIPLVGQDPSTSFVLDLRYSLEGDYQDFDLPEFPEDPAVQKVYLAVYLPDEIKLLYSEGPWTEEFRWAWNDMRLQPRPNLSDDKLVSWVREGINANAGPIFQKDGSLYLYSALRPEPPPGGALHLTTTPQWTLNAAIIGGLLLVGLLLLRTTLSSKLAAITFLVMLTVALGVFLPTFAQQLLAWPMIAGLVIVGIGWWAWHVNHAFHEIDWQRTFAGGIRRKSEATHIASAKPASQESAAEEPVFEEFVEPPPPPASNQSSPEEGTDRNEGGKNV